MTILVDMSLKTVIRRQYIPLFSAQESTLKKLVDEKFRRTHNFKIKKILVIARDMKK